MKRDIEQCGVRRCVVLGGIVLFWLVVLVAASANAALRPSQHGGHSVYALPQAAVARAGYGFALPALRSDQLSGGFRSDALQAVKIWDLTDVHVEVREGGTLVFTRTLPYGGVGASHAYSANLWEVSSWSWVTGTARLNGSVHLSLPASVQQGQPAVFSLSGAFGVQIRNFDDARWDQFTHYGDLGGLGGYATQCYGSSFMQQMTGPAYSESVNTSCTLTPQAHFSNSWVYTIRGYTSLMWRSTTGPTVSLTVRPTYQLRASSDGHVAMQGVVNAGSHYPLIGVPVTVVRAGKVLAQAVTQPPDGRYIVPRVPITNNVVLSVTLEHAASTPSTFRVMYSRFASKPLAYVATRPYTITGGSASVVKDVVFSDVNWVTTSATINRAHLDDLAVIYYHSYQAWQLTDRLKQSLDGQLPVDIRAFSAEEGVYWEGPGSTGANSAVDPYINIEAAGGSSDAADGGRPDNREWHEFGHHVMADMFNNMLPLSPSPCRDPQRPGDECNHGGYANASTTDSWTEGFAEFFSLMVGREIQQDVRADLYRWDGADVSLEPNYLTWTGHATTTAAVTRIVPIEEFAVAGLLWDLVDPVDADDATTFADGLTYADCVQIDLDRLWRLVSRPWGGAVAGSPVAPAGYTYIFDVRHLYDVLKLDGVGSTRSRGRAFDDLDELFIAHGFIRDANGNRQYDVGEVIGHSGYPSRLGRRSRPPIQGSYIAFSARDALTGAPLPVQSLTVDVRFPAPLSHLNYSYAQDASQTPGRAYFVAPDRQHRAVARITAWAPGFISSAPLTLTSAVYWSRMSTDPQDHFIEHTFEMTRTSSAYLPVIISEYGPTPAPVASRGAAAASAQITRACVPAGPGSSAAMPIAPILVSDDQLVEDLWKTP